jgi:hypothetical protein
MFRRNKESFLNPKLLTHGKVMLPPLLDQNPELKKLLLRYATANLNELTAELLLVYIHDTALPTLLEEFRADLECPEYTMFE